MTKLRLASLVTLPLLFACGPDSTELPLAPAGRAPLFASDEPTRFGDWSTPVNLGPVVNSMFVDTDPFMSKDGLTLYFIGGGNLGGSGGRDIWVSQRASVDDPWEKPRNLGSVINSTGHEDRPTLSVDGHRLYFASDRAGGFGDFDLYVSRRRDKRDDLGWEPPVNLGSAVNTAFSEQSSVAIFEDDATDSKIMYFSSNRPGGLGDFDLYAIPQSPDGTYGATQLVKDLSTAQRDRDPSVRRDGLEIFFASNRPGTYGGMDLWTATRASTADMWSVSTNLGPDINTPPRPPGEEQANDHRPSLSFDGTTLYFASAFRSGNVSIMFDIWVTKRSKIKGPA